MSDTLLYCHNRKFVRIPLEQGEDGSAVATAPDGTKFYYSPLVYEGDGLRITQVPGSMLYVDQYGGCYQKYYLTDDQERMRLVIRNARYTRLAYGLTEGHCVDYVLARSPSGMIGWFIRLGSDLRAAVRLMIPGLSDSAAAAAVRMGDV